jgi:poly(A) polymerase
MVEQPRFRAALDFLRLRARTGEVPEDLPDWWERFWQADEAERGQMIGDLRQQSQARATRVRGRGRAADAEEAPPPVEQPIDAETPRKRRRRRRGRGSGGAQEGPADGSDKP